MKHLLNIREENGKSVISARELYEFLEPKSQFTNWCERMFEYGFIKDIDFITILLESTGGRPGIDYALTLDCAKEISMLQRSDKGKEARSYFIECEKRLLSPSEDEMILRAVTALQNRVDAVKSQLDQAKQIISIQAPKVKFAEEVLDSPDLIPVTIIAKDLGMSATQLNKTLNKRGVIFKQCQTWVLYSKYHDKGFAHTKTHTYVNSDGKLKTAIQTYWTQKGRQFIHELLGRNLLAIQ